MVCNEIPSKHRLEMRLKVKPKKWWKVKTMMQIPNAKWLCNFIPAFFAWGTYMRDQHGDKQQLLEQLLKAKSFRSHFQDVLSKMGNSYRPQKHCHHI
jgi:hypothetical protein